jgi:hypothetical protein
MKPLKPNREMEITVADDDNLPEAQVAHVGLRPETASASSPYPGTARTDHGFAGSLADLPDILLGRL